MWCALNRTLTTMDELETVIEGAAKDIGICELKEEQKKAVYSFVGGKMCLFPCRQGMAIVSQASRIFPRVRMRV